jgi:hypothetical protein
VTGRDEAGRFGIGNQRNIVIRGFDRTEAGLGQPDALGRQLVEVGPRQAGFQDDGAGNHAHSARSVIGKTALRGNRQRLDALDVARPARDVHLRCRNRGGDAAVQIALEVADGALARCVVAKGDVDMRVDQARYRRHPAGIDHHVDGRYFRGGSRADADDLVVVNQDGVARCDRLAPVTGDDLAEIGDRDFHAVPSSRQCPANSSPRV